MKFYSFTLFTVFAVLGLAACGKKAQAEPQPKRDSMAVAHDTVVEKPKEESFTFETFSKKLKTKHFAYDTKFVLAQSNSNPNLANAINEWVNSLAGSIKEISMMEMRCSTTIRSVGCVRKKRM